MFSTLALLSKLEGNLETKQSAQSLQADYSDGLQAAYQDYLAMVRDPKTGLVKGSVRLSSARDSAERQSSFYDNVILWKTQQLATQLGIDQASGSSLESLRSSILKRYWENDQGHFIDDVAPGNQHSYSSDWLIALPVGFLQPSAPDDLAKLRRISGYIDQQRLAEPVPIRYTATDNMKENVFVRLFAGNYGNTATWSYWGNLYIELETALYSQTHDPGYAHRAQESLSKWTDVIVRDRGYPETLDS